jgi:hypothetical protein
MRKEATSPKPDISFVMQHSARCNYQLSLLVNHPQNIIINITLTRTGTELRILNVTPFKFRL